MLTPRDILNVQFKTSFRGYNEEQVNEFLKKVVVEYEALYQENQKLREQLAQERQKLEELRRKEGQIDELLDMAREAAKETKEAARREADTILQQARLQAEAEKIRLQQELLDKRQRVEALQRQEQELRRRVRSFLVSLLDEVEQGLNAFNLPEPDDEAEDAVLPVFQETAAVDESRGLGGEPVFDLLSRRAQAERRERAGREEDADDYAPGSPGEPAGERSRRPW